MSNKNIKKQFLQLLGLSVLKFFVYGLVKTYRIKKVNSELPESLLEKGEKIVVAFWHGKMLVPWYVHRSKKFSALVSKSKDGEILSRVLNGWEYNVIRGSSHIGGKEALTLLEQKVDEGYSVAITPDGPTGPPKKLKAGAVVLAKRKNIPLFLAATASSEKKVLNSWDNFEIPKPFSKVSVVYSDEIRIDHSESREKVTQIIQDCEIMINELEEKAERIVRNNS